MSIYSEEFEAWFKARFWHECYEDVKHHLFAAWQESRAALVIELPTCEYANAVSEYSKGHRQGIRACREAIQSTGAKVK